LCRPGLSDQKMTFSVAQFLLDDVKQFVATCCACKVYSKYVYLRIVLSQIKFPIEALTILLSLVMSSFCCAKSCNAGRVVASAGGVCSRFVACIDMSAIDVTFPLHLDHYLIPRISQSLDWSMCQIFNILDRHLVVAVENQAGRGTRVEESVATYISNMSNYTIYVVSY